MSPTNEVEQVLAVKAVGDSGQIWKKHDTKLTVAVTVLLAANAGQVMV